MRVSFWPRWSLAGCHDRVSQAGFGLRRPGSFQRDAECTRPPPTRRFVPRAAPRRHECSRTIVCPLPQCAREAPVPCAPCLPTPFGRLLTAPASRSCAGFTAGLEAAFRIGLQRCGHAAAMHDACMACACWGGRVGTQRDPSGPRWCRRS
jgi:hypothetical protein